MTGGVAWRNWSGRVTATPREIARPRDDAEVVRSVRRAAEQGVTLLAQGAAHSHAPLVAHDGIVLETDALSGVVRVDVDAMQATLRAGTRIADLGEPLRAAGVALHNQGDIDRQAIAGAIATGTHGTGVALQNLSAGVLGARVVLATGEVVDCDADREPDLFELARLSLGAAGVVVEVRLSVRRAYKLAERMWLEPLDAVLGRIDGLCVATRHFEFFWMPGSERAACKSLDETDAEPVHPLAAEGSRLAWSYEVLANERNDLHSEMEYALPAASGPDCFRALRERIARDFPDLRWPLEYRRIAADDLWISPATGRDTATISVHQGIDAPDEPLFRACEEIFRSYQGRPHWGKVHYQSAAELAALHPRWRDWWRVRDRFDPEGRFLSPYLESLRP